MIPIVFFGTNKFAEIILEAVIKSGLFDIRLVVTQPDRPVGRHQEIEKGAVKILAEKHNIKIDQPEGLKGYELQVTGYKLNIVIEYGLIIPQTILDIPSHGSINIHPSLLPKYRGPSPIQSVLINGEKETGVSIMLMDQKMDHGPILAQNKMTIEPADTYLTLAEKLSALSAVMLIQTVPKFLNGEVKPVEQDNSCATFCKILQKEDGKVDFGRSADDIYNQFRGTIVWPGIYAYLGDKRVKFLNIYPSQKSIKPGIMDIEGEIVRIGCLNGSIQVNEIQMEGKRPMTAAEFVNGYKKLHGQMFQ